MKDTKHKRLWPIENIKENYRYLKKEIINNGLSDYLPLVDLVVNNQIDEILILQKKVLIMKEILIRNEVMPGKSIYTNQSWKKMIQKIGQKSKKGDF